MSAHDRHLQTLEPLAENLMGPNKVYMLTPLLASSIFCGVTWGIMSVQYLKFIVRKAKNENAFTTFFATYLVLASTAYLALFTCFISYFFAQNFGYFATAFDLTYTSWLFLLATVFIHVPCQAFYGQTAYKLSGGSKFLGLLLVVLIGGIVGVGATLKAILPDIVVNLNWLQSFLIKFWISLSTATDVVLTSSIAIMQMAGRSKRYADAGFLRRLRYLIVDAQLPATLISVGLLVILMVKPASPISHLWLGLPLIYPVNVFGTLSSRRSIRDDLEAEAGGDRRESTASTASAKDEKPRIPPAEGRPSFLLSPFPTIAIRRASTQLSQYTSPITAPMMSGIRRASQLLGVMPPVAQKSTKRKTFPFKRKTASSGTHSPVELHPASLAFPLSADAAPMGESELIPRGKALERQHSLVSPENLMGLNVTLGAPTAHPLSPSGSNASGSGDRYLQDPFGEVMTSPRSRSASPRPTMSEALEAHEIFEMPSTPDMMSPKSGHSPMIPSPAAHDAEHAEWK